ncbi:MAG: hypothetical protein DWQ10_12870 [Calditrichaeota bacterium]|nr:MAG: hypothetical protein DWQ10_12870 [Calditrichota bacterium]
MFYSWKPIINQRGVSLVEAMIAIVIFMIIMIGGQTYFVRSKSLIAYENVKRRAVAAAVRKMESMVSLDYAALNSSLNEDDVPVNLGTRTGTRTTTVISVDDAADGEGLDDYDGNTADYKQINIEVAWKTNREYSIEISRYVVE